MSSPVDLMLTRSDSAETAALAICLGLIILCAFRRCSANCRVARWALLDLVFVNAILAFVWRLPGSAPDHLYWFAAVAATLLGSIGLLLPAAEARSPQIEAPEAITREEPAIERLKKAA